MHPSVLRLLRFAARPLPWCGLALVLRLLYLREQAAVSVLFHQPLLDEAELAGSARQLLAGLGFGPEPLFKAPLYPLFLAGVMAISGPAWPYLVRLIQHLCGVGLVLLGYDAARRLAGGSPRARAAGAAAAAVLALYGPLIRLESCLIGDSLTVFLQSALLWALIRFGTARQRRPRTAWAAGAGLLAALSWLLRPTLLPVLPFLAAWMAAARRRWRPAALFLLFPLLGMGGLALRNAAVSGEALALPWQGGYNFHEANRPGANGRYLRQSAFSLAESGNPTRELALDGYRRAHPIPAGGAPDPRRGPVNDWWYARARSAIRADFPAWIALLARKAVYLLSAREIYNIEDYGVQREISPLLRRLPLHFGCLWPFALAAVTLPPPSRGRRRLARLAWLYALLLGGAIALFYASGRFRMPLVFPAAVLAAAALPRVLSAPRRRIAAYLLLAAAGAALSLGDWWGVRSESVRAVEFARLSNAAWRNGEPARALDYARRAEAEDPAYPTLPLLRGQAWYSLGKTDAAARAFRESIARLPADPVAPCNLGILAYYDRGDFLQALAYFQQSLERQPRYSRARHMAARAAIALERTALARALLFPGGGAAPAEGSDLDLLITCEFLAQAERNPGEAERLRQRIRALYGEAGAKRLAREAACLKPGLPPR